MTITDLFYGLVQPMPRTAPPQDHTRHQMTHVCLLATAGEAAGRALLGATFLGAAMLHLAAWHEVVLDAAAQGLPAAAPVLALTTAVEALGGLGLILGFETSPAALALAVLVAIGAPVLGDAWRVAGPAVVERLSLLAARIAPVGALVVIAARGAGPWSLDAGRRRRRHRD